MRIKYHSKYNTVDKNGKGIIMFRYTVAGSEDQMAEYKKAQDVGGHYRETDERDAVPGRPLYFTPNYVGDNGTLGITDKGKVYADTSAFDKVDSLSKRYPGLLGQEIAKLGAQQLIGNLFNTGSTATVSATPVKTEESAQGGLDKG